MEGGELDVRVVRRHEEVQKKSKSMADWTLKRWGATRKSKRERHRVADWTLKRREGTRKSKRERHRVADWTLEWWEGSK